MKICITPISCDQRRRGSTLIIVIALLGLLAFTGMVFFTFAAQERASAEYFSEAAKTFSEDSDDPFPWALQQIILGPTNQIEQKGSILWSPTRRHSLVANTVGPDISLFNGKGLTVRYNGSGLPVVTDDTDTVNDELSNRLNFVDALSGWGATFGPMVELSVTSRRPLLEWDVNRNSILDPFEDLNNNGTLDSTGIPHPDVDYTYPDINNLFLGFKGFAIRDNGVEEDVNLNGILDPGEDLNGNGVLDRRYERVAMFIPSFFRPQYLKSGTSNGEGGLNVPTDHNWYDETISGAHQQYSVRSFRPHALHISGFDNSGVAIRRFLDVNNPAHAAAISSLPGSSGAFPLRRNEGNTHHMNGPNFGKLGVWTGHGRATSDTFELDSDNDGDGIREGIWMDLRYPLQETADGRKYVVLHSFTIYDLDGLIDLNSHGNLAGLPRDATITAGLIGSGNLFDTTSLSRSNQGVGPHEVNPVYALMPTGWTPDSSTAFSQWYGGDPVSRREQGNMELAWIMAGRVDTSGTSPEVIDGRWGDASALWYHRFGAGARRVDSLPRPGRAGNLAAVSSDPFASFNNKLGFDDNLDAFEGIASAITGRRRGFIHPLDTSGRGRRTLSGDPRSPNLFRPDTNRPEQWVQYVDYPIVGNVSVTANEVQYIAGVDGDFSTTGDNLLVFTQPGNTSNFNANFEDPYETIMDHDNALRPDDQIFGIPDLVSAHLKKTDQDNALGLSERLEKLAPLTFGDNSSRSEFFTTLSSSFRHFAMLHDAKFRPWEWSADSDGDGYREFPPRYGVVPEFSAEDPFRPQLRRLLFTEFREDRGIQGQLPMSLNHIVDVNRTAQTPLEGTVEFVRFMRRSGLRLRPLTEHPLPTETDSGGSTARESVTVIPTVTAGSPLPAFPPRTFEEREFWARRDRQQMARDIYVLLYTIGGAEFDTVNGTVFDYTADNSDRSLYSEDRLRLMAQFAVNVVDAMDSDHVITKFEYDKNLADGWNLDDDAYTFSGVSDPAVSAMTTATNVTRDGMYPDDAGDRGVVYGVEAQQLAFSEVLGVRSRNTGDTPATPYDDSNGMSGDPTYFLFVELQNMLPATVRLGSDLPGGETVDNTIWRLVRRDRTTAAMPFQTPLESPVEPAQYLAFATDTRNEISGGGRFTISTTTAVLPGGVAPPSSDLFVDVGTYNAGMMTYTGDFDGTYELIAPNAPSGTMPSTSTPPTDPAWTPRCDLDMLAHPMAYFQQGSGQFLSGLVTYEGHTGLMTGSEMTLEGDFSALSDVGFDLVLQRRLNPDLPSISDEMANPWIEVDRIRISMRDFNIDAGDDAAAVRGDASTDRLRNVRSTERREPLQDVRDEPANWHPVPTTTAFAFRGNSLKGDTSITPDDTLGGNSSSNTGGLQIWQPHPDREFASPGELLTVPLFPPNLLTQRISATRLPAWQQLGETSPNVLNAAGAAAMFLWPDVTPTELAAPDAASADDNRWYRLFQFVEVPSRVNRMLGNYLSLRRLPGKLNLNTIRHREVYAGLLDDSRFMNVNPLGDHNGNGDSDGPFSNGGGFDGSDVLPNVGNRDRWMELVNERDGIVQSVLDPTPALPLSGDEVNLSHWIPGTPNSRPFRSLTHRDLNNPDSPNDDNGLEKTILRRLAMDKPYSPLTNPTGEGGTDWNNPTNDEETNRHWLETGSRNYHKSNAGSTAATMLEHHQLLSKIMNNTSTVSNSFIMYGTAAYFEAYEDPTTGLIQVGGRMGLDLDNDGDPTNDAGWEQRAVFILDRTELFNAYDPGSKTVDWRRMIKYRINLASDGK